MDYSWEALDQIIKGGKEAWGDEFPVTANTLIGVSSLWLPGLLVEIEAVAVI